MRDPARSQLETVKLKPTGMGSNVGSSRRLYTAFRFVRAVAFSQSVQPYFIEAGGETVLQAFHILNQFDIPKGAARNMQRTRTAISSRLCPSGLL